MPSLNRVTLLGTVARNGVDVAFVGQTVKASFSLVLTETGQDGREHVTLVPVEVWGRRAEAVGELESGEVIVVEGKIGKRKRGEQWELVVQTYDAQPLRPATAAARN